MAIAAALQETTTTFTPNWGTITITFSVVVLGVLALVAWYRTTGRPPRGGDLTLGTIAVVAVACVTAFVIGLEQIEVPVESPGV